MAPPALTADELVEDVAEAAPATPARRPEHDRPSAAAATEDVESTVRRRNRHADRLVEAHSELRQLFASPGAVPLSAAKPVPVAVPRAPSAPSTPAAPSVLATDAPVTPSATSRRSTVASDDDTDEMHAEADEVEEEPVDVTALAAARHQRRAAALRALLEHPSAADVARPGPTSAVTDRTPAVTDRAAAGAGGTDGKEGEEEKEADDDSDGWEPASDDDDDTNGSATTPSPSARSRRGNAARSPASPAQTPSPVRTSPSLAFARRQRLAAKLAELRR